MSYGMFTMLFPLIIDASAMELENENLCAVVFSHKLWHKGQCTVASNIAKCYYVPRVYILIC